MPFTRTPRLILCLFAAFVLQGCGTNPVTGERELQFVSAAQEIAIGQQNYAPTRQMQGGDYVVDPQVTQYVQGIGQRLAAASGRADLPYEFAVLNNSVPNAWAMPGGKIALNRGLLTEMDSEAELAAVIGHEIVHAAARHGAKSIERGTLLQVGLLAVQISQADSEYGGYAVAGAQVGAQLISQTYGRSAELQSDLYGMRYMKDAGYDPSAAVDLQETFVRLSEGRQTGWLSGLFASHPPSELRVERNKETLAELGAGGEMGRERYQQMIATLKRDQPAYEAFDKGTEALRSGDVAAAQALAQQAIDRQPAEARFHGLYGDTLLQQKNFRGALGYYSAAIERNPGYFQPYLTSGIAAFELDDLTSAEQYFQQSLQMLPTATAYNGLGMVALRTGRRADAVKFLEQAATSNSAVGAQAAGTLAQLDPQRFIATRLGTDSRGYVAVQVQNSAPIAMREVELEVQIYDANGQLAGRQPLTVSQGIAAQDAVIVSTGLGPVTDTSQLQRVRVVVSGATPEQ